MYENFENGGLNGIILGDSGYACKRWLIPPFRENQVQGCAKRMNFNIAQKSARCHIERAFGQVKRRWASIHGEVRLSPEKACKLIFASFALHNLAKFLNEEEINNNQQQQGPVQPNQLVYNGREENGVRQSIVDRYF